MCKMLIFCLAGSALLAQVPILSNGGNAVGGSNNLTTVGAVPYVSAPGTLNQDPADFFWDATNNRLGIGSNAPITLLHAQGPAFTTFTNNPATLFMSSTDAYAANMGSGILFAGKLDSGNTTISTYAYIGGLKENATDGNGAGKLVFGTRQNGVGANDMTRMTILSSGNVGIGTAIPGYALDVAKSSGSGTARFYDQTATTGSTAVSINRGAAQTGASTVLALDGVVFFGGDNNGGAGAALLGANSPATTLAAPYTWIKIRTADNSIAYIPVWK